MSDHNNVYPHISFKMYINTSRDGGRKSNKWCLI